MTPSIPSTAATAGGPYAALAPKAPGTDVTKNMFLQLLVAQLKNQDPLNPTDSTQFVSQLAQMQQLEQATNMGQDVAAIRQDADQLLAATGSAQSTNNSSSSKQS